MCVCQPHRYLYIYRYLIHLDPRGSWGVINSPGGTEGSDITQFASSDPMQMPSLAGILRMIVWCAISDLSVVERLSAKGTHDILCEWYQRFPRYRMTGHRGSGAVPGARRWRTATIASRTDLSASN